METDGFLLFLVMGKWFSILNGMVSGIFGAVKLMKFKQSCPFSLGSPCDIAYFVFPSKVRNFRRKCLRSTASPLC